MNRALATLLFCMTLVGCANARRAEVASSSPTTRATTQAIDERTVRRPSIDRAIDDGVNFLVSSQNADGSWGTGTVTRGTEIYSMVPGSHDAYRVATSALCVMALREAIASGRNGESITAAHQRGVSYLVDHNEARRDQGDLLYNTWAHIFALQAFAEEMSAQSPSPDPKLAEAARVQLARMEKYATHLGGWNYYDFEAHTQQPSLGPTSFGTAAGLVALWEAKEAGIVPPPRMVDLCLRRLLECRLPTGLYLYGTEYKYIPHIPANMEGGAIGRTQPSNDALWQWSYGGIDEAKCAEGLDKFFDKHQFLEMGRKRPFPHEAWYQTSGYYYYFDHYYAARMIHRMKDARREDYKKQLIETVMPYQESDGSWWDYAMWDYHKPYGTAFAVMTLLRCK